MRHTDLTVKQFRRFVAVDSVQPVRKFEISILRNDVVVFAITTQRIIVDVQIQLQTALGSVE